MPENRKIIPERDVSDGDEANRSKSCPNRAFPSLQFGLRTWFIFVLMLSVLLAIGTYFGVTKVVLSFALAAAIIAVFASACVALGWQLSRPGRKREGIAAIVFLVILHYAYINSGILQDNYAYIYGYTGTWQAILDPYVVSCCLVLWLACACSAIRTTLTPNRAIAAISLVFLVSPYTLITLDYLEFYVCTTIGVHNRSGFFQRYGYGIMTTWMRRHWITRPKSATFFVCLFAAIPILSAAWSAVNHWRSRRKGRVWGQAVISD